MSYRKWVIIAASLFVIGLILGFVTPDSLASLFSEDVASLGQLGDFIMPFSTGTVVFIWAKNALSLLLSFFLSPFFFIVPLVALTVNGWLLTVIAALVANEKSLGYVLVGLLPHGIVELPAFIIGEAAALSFGAMAMLAVFSPQRRAQFLPNFKQNLKYLALALALLVPAAIIETYFTPWLLGRLG
jgi:stage II sporulation protein M